jgi:hypothetical protein
MSSVADAADAGSAKANVSPVADMKPIMASRRFMAIRSLLLNIFGIPSA